MGDVDDRESVQRPDELEDVAPRDLEREAIRIGEIPHDRVELSAGAHENESARVVQWPAAAPDDVLDVPRR